jgi:hypothetical protein
MSSKQGRSKRMGLLLVLLPLWLLGSGVAALIYYFHHEKQQAAAEQLRFSNSVSIPTLTDDLKKIVEIIGERHASSEAAAKNLSRMASMIEGSLGPSNTGFAVKKVRGPAEWPILQVTLSGKKPAAPAVWVITSYDSRPASKGADANATGLAATLAAAQALASEKWETPVHFVFLPHANDPDSPAVDTAARFLDNLKSEAPPKAVLCVEAMGAGEELWLSSRDTTAIPLSLVDGLGKVLGAEIVCLGEDSDLASLLFELGLPAVRVATRAILTAGEPDDRLPFTPTVAAASGRLIDLIQRCATKP